MTRGRNIVWTPEELAWIEANARLIATAPELLASLRECFALAQLKDSQKDDPKLLDEILGRAFEAIRKAEGR